MISRLQWDERRHKWRPVFPWWWWWWTACGLAVTMSVTAVVAQRRAMKTWTPLQRAYAWSYAWSAAALTLDRYSGSYSLLHVRRHTGSTVALDTDVRGEDTAIERGVLRLSDAAIQAGGRRLEWSEQPYPHALVYGFLRAGIYGDRSLLYVLDPALSAARTVLLIGLLLTIAWRLWLLLAAGGPRDSPRVSSTAAAPTSPSPTPVEPPVAGPRRTPIGIVAPPSTAVQTARSQPSKASEPVARPPRPPAPFFE